MRNFLAHWSLILMIAPIVCVGQALAQERTLNHANVPVTVAADNVDVGPLTMPQAEYSQTYPPIFIPPLIQPTPGFRFEISFAPPVNNIPTDPYQMGKYGRLSLDYTPLTVFDGSDLGVMIQAMHVAHHLLLYSAGFTTDINKDGKFLLTAGLAHYQTGNAPTEPFVDAPFIRFRMQSLSENDPFAVDDDGSDLFVYSEVETTMHFRSYISGTAGLGLRLTPMLRMIGGWQHTEFIMPTERAVRTVDGLQGILQWGM
ncbi:MAG: hypothetical protein Q8922_10140 [Bacteroidota bacterium]|nr:hypothetical protein [Bacteroidota bacterium]MDP4232414.1 hypothetical protein [Bacteroidota bacterium]MDP4241550.1 hypothetical protein [Bacteroidota bacterium]MDP4288284.1 hypothetical protein [Bacteroidota bacterium]